MGRETEGERVWMSEMRDSDSCSGSDAGLNGISREWNRVKPGWRRGGGIHSSFIFLCGTLPPPVTLPWEPILALSSSPLRHQQRQKNCNQLLGGLTTQNAAQVPIWRWRPNFFADKVRQRVHRETSVYCALPFAVTQRSRTHTELESRWESTQGSDSDCLEPKTKYLPVATWPGKTGKVKTDQVQLWWPRWILFIVNKNTPKRSPSLYIKVSSAWGQRRILMETLVKIYDQ